jgi:hypothetical protein
MGFMERLALARVAAPAEAAPAARLSETPVAVPSAGDTILTRSDARAYRIALGIARSIPSVRKAEHVIAGTLGTFPLVARVGRDTVPAGDSRVAWLTQPDPARTLQWMLTKTFHDVLWYDRCVWKISDTTVYGTPVGAVRIHPNRVDTIADPLDPDVVGTWIIDGAEIKDPLSRGYIIFDGAGLGGLTRYGYDLLTLYGQLQAAAGRYAVAPHPHAILKNSGADLEDDEIDALLAKWEAARATRSIGYLNDVMAYEQQNGWSARELQLVEAREHAALETARLFGLPAQSLDATGGGSLTYGNVIEYRKDELRALQPWRSVVEQTLSMDDRRGRPRGLVVPHGMKVYLDTSDYARDDAATRMGVWDTAIRIGAMTVDEVIAAEPLAGVKP